MNRCFVVISRPTLSAPLSPLMLLSTQAWATRNQALGFSCLPSFVRRLGSFRAVVVGVCWSWLQQPTPRMREALGWLFWSHESSQRPSLLGMGSPVLTPQQSGSIGGWELTLPRRWRQPRSVPRARSEVGSPLLLSSLAMPRHAVRGFRGWKRRRRRMSEVLAPSRKYQRMLLSGALSGLSAAVKSQAVMWYTAQLRLGAATTRSVGARTPVFFLDRAYFFPQRLARLPARLVALRGWKRRLHRWRYSHRHDWRLSLPLARVTMGGGRARVRGANRGRVYTQRWGRRSGSTFYGQRWSLVSVTAHLHERVRRVRWAWEVRARRLRFGRFLQRRQLWRRAQWRRWLRGSWAQGSHPRRRLPALAWSQFYRQPQVPGLWLRSQPWLAHTSRARGAGQLTPALAEARLSSVSPMGGYLGAAWPTWKRQGWRLGRSWGVGLAAGQQLHHLAGVRKAGFRARLYSQLPRGLRAHLLPVRTRQLLARFQRSQAAVGALGPNRGVSPIRREVRYTNTANPLLRLAYKQPWRQAAGVRGRAVVRTNTVPLRSIAAQGWGRRVWQHRRLRRRGRLRHITGGRGLATWRMSTLSDLPAMPRARLLAAPQVGGAGARRGYLPWGRELENSYQDMLFMNTRPTSADKIRFADFVKTFFQPHVRYRPGFAKYWRLHRHLFRLLYGSPWGHSQRRLTVYIARLRYLTGFSFLRLLQLSLVQLIWSSGLAGLQQYVQVWTLIRGGVVYINGLRCQNPLKPLHQADVIAVRATGKVFQFLSPGPRSYLLWLRWRGWANVPQPPRLPSSLIEVDELTSSIAILGEYGGDLTSLLLPARVPFSTLKCYNWKYVV